jgi:putative acetyltransferase
MMHIRPATPADAQAIFALHCVTFPDDSEARLVEALVAEGDALVSLVAELAGEIVGHVMFSRMAVTGDGRDMKAAGLAPVSTNPAHQERGIAAALIEQGLDDLRGHGMEISFVLGNPEYYARFGYSAEDAARFVSAYACPAFMVQMLDDAQSLPASGTADYAPAFARLEV